MEERAPTPSNTAKRERFVLLKRNDDEYYPYYAIRAQHDYTKRKLGVERRNFPNLEVLLDFRQSQLEDSLHPNQGEPED